MTIQPSASLPAQDVLGAIPGTANPGPSALAGHRHAPLKTQATAVDARAERLVRQVRTEVDDLRRSFDRLRDVPEEFTGVDLHAIAENPDAAAALPPALLVRALIDAGAENRRLERRLRKTRSRATRLEARFRELRLEKEWYAGRQETLDAVIAALHANIEDLRLARDATRRALPAPNGTHALSPASEPSPAIAQP